MHELLAWIVFPLVALALCAGIGMLAERVAGVELHPALLPALGFATAIVLLGPLFATGAGAVPGLLLLTAAAAAGFGLRARRLAQLRPGFGALAGVAAYALHIAPVALSGTATFLGYNLLNDTAIHLALVDWISHHGSRWLAQPPSSYAAAIHEYVGTDYPLGSHELLAALKPVVGLDPALVYQPFLALSAALAAVAFFALLRRERAARAPAALAAVAALASQLVFSFALQGGIKEITFITCLAAAAALGGSTWLVALPAAAMYAIYGVYALAWILPLGLVAIWAARPPLRTVVAAAGAFVLAVAVDIPGSIHYWRHGHSVITRGSELGPLARPLQPFQAAGIWLNGDYRFTPSLSWLNLILILAVLALAVGGLAAALRRRSVGPLMLVVSALVAWAVVQPAGSPYVDAKALAVLSPAVVIAACIGLGGPAAAQRVLAIAAAVVLGGALLVSDALAYRIALLAPVDRLGELAAIDRRFAGQGPVLVNEFEEYVKHYMRRSRGSDPYEKWTAGRAQLRNPALRVAVHAYDLDQMTPAFVERWPLIVLRRSPAESRPPSNYTLAWRGRWYEVWRRSGPAPLRHVALDRAPLDPTEPLSCPLVRSLAAQGRVVAALRPAPLVIGIHATAPLPPGWYRDAQDRYALDVRKGGSASWRFKGGGPLRIWLRGRTFRRDQVLVDGRPVGIARQANGPNQWIDVGRVLVAPGGHVLELRRPTHSLRPGDAQTDVIGPFEVVVDAPPQLVSGARLRSYCGFPADWIDVVRR